MPAADPNRSRLNSPLSPNRQVIDYLNSLRHFATYARFMFGTLQMDAATRREAHGATGAAPALAGRLRVIVSRQHQSGTLFDQLCRISVAECQPPEFLKYSSMPIDLTLYLDDLIPVAIFAI
jgi:hypothetical protein